ncbi:MAG: hypothetical protein KC486_03455 [Myxococcales bacterium]|nr:hypothetical protein [Myxococcales bacterium]
MGPTDACAGATVEFSVMMIDGATDYVWTVPDGATIDDGQGTEAITVTLGDAAGQVCLSYSLGCAASEQTCVDVAIQGGGNGMETFAYTGNAQEFVVPECVSQITVEAWGAQGGGAKCCGNNIQDDGGKGGYAKGTLDVTPGESLLIYVGGKGVTEGAGGFNGGGQGGQWGAGGGGASDVRLGGDTLADRILVGGGGGGGNCGCPEHGAGGAGGGLDGVVGTNGGGGFTPGGGASQNAGGTAGSNPGAPGALGAGGGSNGSTYHIGGGGGGFYGGGGAYAAGGGGGSSYYGNAVDPVTTPDQRSGDGEVIITW